MEKLTKAAFLCHRRATAINCPDRKLLVLVKKNRAGKNSELRRSPTTTEEPVLNLPTENDISNRETEQPNEQSIVEAEPHDMKEQKCGTAESNYQPCTSRGIADKLFLACCQLYVPDDCHHLCTYETEQLKTRRMLLDMVKQKKCGMKHLSTILYCASQNRDNRKCCETLDLNAPSLQVD
ncbi:hypothetical protein WR25_12248 isoform A [Diploscapter pachys]|uniref:Domain of unknown function DB domain-containing protein n=1 Tax=Diploscapter pachys TaxID=2018661 RepID=A0A2A2LEM3_9BILA|nr:hypothetical protein WR25_12248 isoform A [Diploscapter pachys]